jgi:PKD repeat protein
MASSLLAQAGSPDSTDYIEENWCYTQIKFQERAGFEEAAQSPSACTQYGSCDDPGTRNGWIPNDSSALTYIRMVIHILRNDNGGNAISSDQLVHDQMAQLNVDFLPARIQFDYTINYVNSTAWRTLSEGEINAMKTATAIKPDSQLNVWVTYVNFGYSFGTFPWDSDARTKRGGIVMGHFHWVYGVNKVFAHEVGHCLGLWHTFHGTVEVSACGPCYESPNGANRDLLGDRCEDTPPNTDYGGCSNTPGADGCTGQPWGYTMPENYMGYTPQSCYSLFTEQQRGRMRCWINDELSGWVEGVRFFANSSFGSAPLTVDFTGNSTLPVNEWLWDFGDGEGSSEMNPSHTYNTPGYHTVGLTIQTPDGPYSNYKPGFISVHADTAFIDDLESTPGAKLRVDINVNNYLPLRALTLPLVWDGPFDLVFDSFSTAGLRTEYFEVQNLLNYDPSRFRMTFYLKTSHTNTAIPALEPGSGAVMSVYFTVPIWARTGSNPLVLQAYNAYSPVFEADAGVYEPTTVDGSVSTGCCEGLAGNVDADPLETVDIGDLTALIDYLYISNNLPECYNEANVDGDIQGRIDIGDLTALINYLYTPDQSLPTCF